MMRFFHDAESWDSWDTNTCAFSTTSGIAAMGGEKLASTVRKGKRSQGMICYVREEA